MALPTRTREESSPIAIKPRLTTNRSSKFPSCFHLSFERHLPATDENTVKTHERHLFVNMKSLLENTAKRKKRWTRKNQVRLNGQRRSDERRRATDRGAQDRDPGRGRDRSCGLLAP